MTVCGCFNVLYSRLIDCTKIKQYCSTKPRRLVRFEDLTLCELTPVGEHRKDREKSARMSYVAVSGVDIAQMYNIICAGKVIRSKRCDTRYKKQKQTTSSEIRNTAHIDS